MVVTEAPTGKATLQPKSLVIVRSAQNKPPTWLGLIPSFWSRVLFPGSAMDAGPVAWRAVLMMILGSAAVLYPCLQFELFEPDEGRYAQIPREMLERGEWVVPTLQGEPYLDKPPLYYWLVMASYSIFGFHAWAARLVPALSVHATLLLTWALGRRLLGERPALWGAWLLAVSPLFFGMGRLLLLDGLITLWVTASLLCACLAFQKDTWNQRAWFAAAVFCGLGILTKGPIALVLVMPPIVAHRWLTRTPHRASWRAWTAFVAIAAGIAAPWYCAVMLRAPEFGGYFFLKHNLQRFLQPFDHERPVWFYVPIALYGLLPLTVCSPWLLGFLVSRRRSASEWRTPAVGLLLLAALWCLFFFSLAGCKLPTYILPAFPPLCLAAGSWVASRSREQGTGWLKLVIGACATVVVLGHFVAIPWYAWIKSPMQDRERIFSLCGDRSTPVACFPRNVDSVAFYVGRSDFVTYRSKNLAGLLKMLDENPRVVVLFGHRNSRNLLASRLPPHLSMHSEAPMGLCSLAIVERIPVAVDPSLLSGAE